MDHTLQKFSCRKDCSLIFNFSIHINSKGKSLILCIILFLREIVIDGNNVAYAHGKFERFSASGILYCYKYFHERNHKVHAFYTTPKNASDEDR